jgi:rubrerythrin
MSKVYYTKWMELNQMKIDTDFILKPYGSYRCEECNIEIARMKIDTSENVCPICSNRKENNETNV